MDQYPLKNLSTSFLETLAPIVEPTRKLWNSSKLFRITSIITGSIAVFGISRTIYIKSYRKYKKLPPGPNGMPYLGQSYEIGIFDESFFKSLAVTYPSMASLIFGPFVGVVINDPKIAKKVYSGNRMLERMSLIVENNAFLFSNGKTWSERRRIIYSNLMSTMKASYVETATKRFIKNKVFPVFNDDIKNNKLTQIKELFRPIGFNIVLQACFGKELSSIKDPFWNKWDKLSDENNRQSAGIFIIMFLFGGNNFLSRFLINMFIGDTITEGFEKLVDLLDDYSKDSSNNIISDEEVETNVKLFKDYVENYVNNDKKGGTKWKRRDLLADMAVIFFAAVDTTYSALNYSLLLAAKYPNIQEELHEELMNAFGHNVDNVELRNQGICKIPKLRAFIQETLRIHPPVPIVGFRCMSEKNYTVDVGDGKTYVIPFGALTVINAIGIAMDPKNWIRDYNVNKHGKINMEEIHFDFWLDDDGQFIKQKNSSSFFAFHYGKRDCVGQALAMKELIIVLAMIFMTYKVSIKDGRIGFKIETQFSGILNEPTMQSIRFQPRCA